MKKFKQWIVTHKLISIVTSAVLVVGITLAIVLPITLSHKHTFSKTWAFNETTHWHVCTGEDCNEKANETAHAYGGWTVTTPAGYGVDIVKEHTCIVCDYTQEQTVENTKLETHNTLVIRINDFFKVSNHLVGSGYILSGTVAVGDKLKVDKYNGELTVAKISNEEDHVEVNSIDYNYSGEVAIMFEENVETSEMGKGVYVTKSGAPVQRYTKLTLSITTTTEKSTPIFNNYRPNLTIGGQTVTVLVSDITNTVEGSEVAGILGNGGTGTMTVTITDENVSVVALIGMEVVGKDGTKTVFNGTVTGVLTAE